MKRRRTTAYLIPAIFYTVAIGGCDLLFSDGGNAGKDTSSSTQTDTQPSSVPPMNVEDASGGKTEIDPASLIKSKSPPQKSNIEKPAKTSSGKSITEKKPAMLTNELIIIERGGEEGDPQIAYQNGQLKIDMYPHSVAPENRYGVMFRMKGLDDCLFVNLTGAFTFEFGEMTPGGMRLLESGPLPESVILEKKRAIEITFMGSYVAGRLDGEELFESVVKRMNSGQTGFHFSKADNVEIRNVETWDYARTQPNVSGVLQQEGRPVANSDVRAVLLFDTDTLMGAKAMTAHTDANGRFSFFLPKNRQFIIEAGATEASVRKGNGVYGARFVDTHFVIDPLTVTLHGQAGVRGGA
jgi:hypothetical protein